MISPESAGPAPEPAVTIAAAVRAVPGVADLYGGLFGEVATHLAGQRVPGVRLDERDNVEVHIVTQWGAPVPATAYAVRRTVARLTPGAVHVVVADVASPLEPGSSAGRTGGGM